MKGAERNTGRIDLRLRVTTHADNERDYLISDVSIILLMADRLMPGLHRVVEPTLAVDRVDREAFHLSGIENVLDRADQMKALVLQVVGRGRGEHEQSRAVVAVHRDLHFLVEGR